MGLWPPRTTENRLRFIAFVLDLSFNLGLSEVHNVLKSTVYILVYMHFMQKYSD